MKKTFFLLTPLIIALSLQAADQKSTKEHFHQHAEAIRLELEKHGIVFEDDTITFAAQLEVACAQFEQQTGQKITPEMLFKRIQETAHETNAYAERLDSYISPSDLLDLFIQTNHELGKQKQISLVTSYLAATGISAGALTLASVYGNCSDTARVEFRKAMAMVLLQATSTVAYTIKKRTLDPREEINSESLLQPLLAALSEPLTEKLTPKQALVMDILAEATYDISSHKLETLNNSPMTQGAKRLMLDLWTDVKATITQNPTAAAPTNLEQPERRASALTYTDCGLYVVNAALKHATEPVTEYAISKIPTLKQDAELKIKGYLIITKHQALHATAQTGSEVARYAILAELSQNKQKDASDPTKLNRLTAADIAKFAGYNLSITLTQNALIQLGQKYAPSWFGKEGEAMTAGHVLVHSFVPLAAITCVNLGIKATNLGIKATTLATKTVLSMPGFRPC